MLSGILRPTYRTVQAVDDVSLTVERDEPTIGLDVVIRQKIRDLIRRVNAERRVTVFLTSHDTGDIEKSVAEPLSLIMARSASKKRSPAR